MSGKGVNKVIIIGNLGSDPEYSVQQNGSGVATISVATSRSWKDKNTGQKQEQTEWHRIVFFGKVAEVAAEYLRKGSKVYVEGYLKTNKWTDKNGVERYTTQIVADQMQMLDSTGGGSSKGSASKPQVVDNEESFDDDTPF